MERRCCITPQGEAVNPLLKSLNEHDRSGSCSEMARADTENPDYQSDIQRNEAVVSLLHNRGAEQSKADDESTPGVVALIKRAERRREGGEGKGGERKRAREREM